MYYKLEFFKFLFDGFSSCFVLEIGCDIFYCGGCDVRNCLKICEKFEVKVVEVK